MHFKLGRRRKSLRAGMADFEETFNSKVANEQPKRRTADMEKVAEQVRVDHAKHTPWYTQWQGDVH